MSNSKNPKSEKSTSLIIDLIKDLLLRLNPDELFEIQSEIYLLLEKYNQARDSDPKHPPPPPTGGD